MAIRISQMLGPPTGDARAPVKLTVKETAEAFRKTLAENRVLCGEIRHSVNREGGASAYFDISAEDARTCVRISDHDANPFFRVNETHVYVSHATAERAIELAAELIAFARRTAAKAELERAERTAFEAPFRERFLRAKAHDQHAILCEAYPRAAGDPHLRREIRGRWLAQDPEPMDLEPLSSNTPEM